MPIIAIVNRKGGSGKSTLATHIAVAWAKAGKNVMVGDVDRQQSIRSWLRRRGPSEVPISTWVVDRGKGLRPPPGTSHVILDTPGALYDLDLAKLIMRLDAVVVPVGPSVFDQDASLDFLAELRRWPRVMNGSCQVAVVGMRWPEDRTQRWFDSREWNVPLVTVFPDSAEYSTHLHQGRTFFDRTQAHSHPDMRYWAPLIQWLDALEMPRESKNAEDLGEPLPRMLLQHPPRVSKPLTTARSVEPDPEGKAITSMAAKRQAMAGLPVLQQASVEVSNRHDHATPEGVPVRESSVAVESTVDLGPAPVLTGDSMPVTGERKGFWATGWRRMFG